MAAQYENMLGRLEALATWSNSDEAAVMEPFTYITANPGKEIRGRMISAFNTWLNVPEHKLKTITKVVSMLHSASLLIDDIEDDSQLRRGAPVAHKIYGVPQTINSANYVYFLAFKELFSLSANDKPGTNCVASAKDLEMVVTMELLNLHRGQGLDLLWRDSLQCPTEDEYIAMVNNKTGGLFRLAIRLMMACASTNNDVDYVPLVNLIGIYFQIRDDYMNLTSTDYSENKGFAEDLTEGKFSFPIVHAILADKANRQVMNVLQKRPATPTLKRHTIAYLRNHTKSFEYTRKVLTTLERQAREEIARLGGNPGLESIMDAMHVPDEADL